MAQTPSPARSPFSLGAIARSLQGKAPVSDVREKVKEVLRIYGVQDWAKLKSRYVQTTARLAKDAIMRNNKSDPLSHVYVGLLDILGDSLPTVILHDLDEVYSPDLVALNQTVERTRYNAKFAVEIFKPVNKLIEKFPTTKERSPVELEALAKIEQLLTDAKNGIRVFYAAKLADINLHIKAVKVAVKTTVKTPGATSGSTAVTRLGGKRKTKRSTRRRNRK